jgi:hypothetical protein
MNNFKFSIQNPVNLLILLIFVQALISCGLHTPDTQLCSGVEFNPNQYACVRGELVLLDDNLPSSSSSSGEQEISGVWNGTANTSWYNASQSVFTITTAEQLAGFAKLVNEGNSFEGKTVKLGNNIALNDTSYWRNWVVREPDNEWEPIGTAAVRDDDLLDSTIFFAGTFDGNGFVVSGVYINSAEPFKGFFGFVASKGTIKNLGVVASYVKGGRYYVGGLVGIGYGSGKLVNNSYYRGTVTGDTAVGGLVGGNIGEGSTLSNSYYSGVVTGKMWIGGLVGVNGGNGNNISNSYSAGTVAGELWVGGLAGFSGGDNNGVKNSYSSCVVTGAIAGGLVGDNSGDSRVTGSYYDKNASGQSDYRGVGKTTSEMKRQATYAGWDFNGIWGISEDINGGYPYLLGTQQ